MGTSGTRAVPTTSSSPPGFRIGPFEVESACLEHPAVAEAAAVGKPDERRGTIVKAFVVLAAGHEPSDELGKEIGAHVRSRLSAYAYPREVEFVDDLPKTLTGKIRRVELRQRELDREGGRMASTETTHDDLARRLEELQETEHFDPPEAFVAEAMDTDDSLWKEAEKRSGRLVGGAGEGPALVLRVGHGARRLRPAVLQVVRRRDDQRVLQLPRPPRRERARRPRRDPLARRGGRGARRHLRLAARAGPALRQRPEGQRRRRRATSSGSSCR